MIGSSSDLSNHFIISRCIGWYNHYYYCILRSLSGKTIRCVKSTRVNHNIFLTLSFAYSNRDRQVFRLHKYLYLYIESTPGELSSSSSYHRRQAIIVIRLSSSSDYHRRLLLLPVTKPTGKRTS